MHLVCARKRGLFVDTRASSSVLDHSSIRAQKGRVLVPVAAAPVYSAPPCPDASTRTDTIHSRSVGKVAQLLAHRFAKPNPSSPSRLFRAARLTATAPAPFTAFHPDGGGLAACFTSTAARVSTSHQFASLRQTQPAPHRVGDVSRDVPSSLRRARAAAQRRAVVTATCEFAAGCRATHWHARRFACRQRLITVGALLTNFIGLSKRHATVILYGHLT